MKMQHRKLQMSQVPTTRRPVRSHIASEDAAKLDREAQEGEEAKGGEKRMMNHIERTSVPMMRTAGWRHLKMRPPQQHQTHLQGCHSRGSG